MTKHESKVNQERLRFIIDQIRDELLSPGFGGELPPVFREDGTERVAIPREWLQRLADAGQAALLAIQTEVSAYTPGQADFLAIHVRGDPASVSEASLRMTMQLVGETMEAQGWPHHPPVLMFGPELSLEWMGAAELAGAGLATQAGLSALVRRSGILEDVAATLGLTMAELENASDTGQAVELVQRAVLGLTGAGPSSSEVADG